MTVSTNPYALTRDDQLRVTALAAARAHLGDRSADEPQRAIADLLDATRKIEAYLRAEETR